MRRMEVEVQCFSCNSWFRTVTALVGHDSLASWLQEGELLKCPICSSPVMATPANTRVPEPRTPTGA